MNENLRDSAISGVGRIISDLYEYSKSEVKEKFIKINALKNLNKFYKNIDDVAKVRTIYSPDEIFHIEDIFNKNAVSIEQVDKLENLSSFPAEHILIEAGPGYGKSFLLKYICVNEIRRGIVIPVFIEFRRMNFEGDFLNSLLNEFFKFGIEIDNDIFEYLIDNNIITLIFDGFDEISSDKRDEVAEGLEQLARKYPTLKIIISSRPEYGLGSSYYYKKIKIKPLNFKSQESLVSNICNEGVSKDIISVIHNNQFIGEILTSPLLVTLFVITYNSTQFNPNNLSEFYNVIFTTMLYRHDRLKLTFDRERKSNLTDYNFQKLFEVISFVLLKKSLSSFSRYQFQDSVFKALNAENLEKNIEDKVIDDITMITALIIKDGYQFYSYAHKSIQEYFSSQYIRRSENDVKIKFYTSVSTNYESFQQWKNVLSFLEITDTYMYKKYFYINLVKYLTGYASGENEVGYTFLENIPENTSFRSDESGSFKELYWPNTFSSSAYEEFHSVIYHAVEKYLKNNKNDVAEYLAYCDVSKYDSYRKNPNDFIINLADFISDEERLHLIVKKEISNSEIYLSIKELEKEVEIFEKINNDIFQGI
jgi:hypothetical protein